MPEADKKKAPVSYPGAVAVISADLVEDFFFFRIKERSIGVENVMEELFRHTFFGCPSPGINGLAFAGDETPVDGGNVQFPEDGQTCLEGTSGGTGHVFGAEYLTAVGFFEDIESTLTGIFAVGVGVEGHQIGVVEHKAVQILETFVKTPRSGSDRL